MSERVRVLTWNVWFGAHRFEERCAALIDVLGRRRPDVVALQEVTAPVRAAIAAAPWAGGYQLHDDDEDGGAVTDYGVLVMSRLPVRSSAVLGSLPTEMGRRLVAVGLDSGLTVATIHLESTASGGPNRVQQLGIIQPWLIRKSDDVCLVGDLNFTPDDGGENAALDPSFVDVWAALRPDDPGYTVDTEVNTMRLAVTGRPSRKRIDRVLLRSARWRATAIERVGAAPIAPDGTFVSDHFGLEVELTATA